MVPNCRSRECMLPKRSVAAAGGDPWSPCGAGRVLKGYRRVGDVRCQFSSDRCPAARHTRIARSADRLGHRYKTRRVLVDRRHKLDRWRVLHRHCGEPDRGLKCLIADGLHHVGPRRRYADRRHHDLLAAGSGEGGGGGNGVGSRHWGWPSVPPLPQRALRAKLT